MAEIRTYNPEDYVQAVEVLKQADMFDQVWDSQDNYNGMVEKDPQSILVAVDQRKVIGTQLIIPFGPNVGFLFRLAVLENYRNQGIGSQLMEEAEKVLKEKGAQEVTFFVDANKADIQEFYTKKGYQTSGTHYLCMWKPLS